MNTRKFKIHPSSCSKITAGTIGLSESQRNRKFELSTRQAAFERGDAGIKPLTEIMKTDLANIMQQEANPQLPAGLKSYCHAWMLEQIYQRKKTFTSKYTERGDISELSSLEVIREMFGYNELAKNETTFENEWIIGTPDAIAADCIIDAKSPWNCFTFPLLETECPEPDYYAQAQAYFDIVTPHHTMFKLVYVLNDMPEALIINEAKNWCFKNGEQFRPEVVDEMRASLTYSNIEDKYKRKVFEIERDDTFIALIHDRVEICRKYIATFEGFEDVC